MDNLRFTYQQTKTLLYRNFLMKWRLKGVTLQEILWPIYFVVLLVILKITAYKPTSYPAEANIEVFDLFNASQVPNATLLYHPTTARTNKIIDLVKKFEQFTGLITTGYNTEGEMLRAYKQIGSINTFGVSFISNYDYKLRASKSIIPSPSQAYEAEDKCRQGTACVSDQYLFSGVSSLQAAIDSSIIQSVNSVVKPPEVLVQRMPKDGTITNAQTFQIITSLYLVMSMSFFMIFLLVFIVTEKERKIKEGMKMMGLRNISLWLSWFLTYVIVIFVMTLIMSIIAVFGQLYPKSNFFLIFLLFFLYGLSVVALSFMMTPFFSKARTAGAVGGIITIVVSLFYLIVAFIPNTSESVIWALSLISPAGFAIGLNQISILEVGYGGASFSNLDAGQYSVLIALIMLPIDTLIYGLLTLYFDSVIPGEYGVKEKPWFFLLPSYWCGRKKGLVSFQSSELEVKTNSDSEEIPEEFNDKEAIRFVNLCKTYGTDRLFNRNSKPTQAVKNFSLNIYEGQITALLGHNGAGKTTIFNILTGFVGSTSGNAFVYNLDVSKTSDVQRVREMTGVCPQYNMHLDMLSVEENLLIFSGIKNISEEDQEDEITRIIKLVDLEESRHTIAKHLSGGQKRKLSVGIAILGDPKILVLDEPTAGMDPLSRRKLWDLLRQRREGKVTLLTTHFMDEADILADRKAIITKGSLRCVGSSLFLKNRFGIGYHLSVVTEEGADKDEISSAVGHHIVGYEVHRETNREVEFTLPILQVEHFSKLFNDLESRGSEIGVKSFGVSMTSLEEVFLKIGEEEDTEDDVDDNFRFSRQNPVLNTDESVVVMETERSVFDPGAAELNIRSNFSIWKALVLKQFLVYIRNSGLILFGFLFPVGLAIGSAGLLNIQVTADDQSNPPTLNLYPGFYNYSVFLYKNSTGKPIDDLFGYVNWPLDKWQASNLSNILRYDPRVFYAIDVNQFETSQVRYKALYNTTAVHSLPIIINSLSQAMLSLVLGVKTQLKTIIQRWPSDDENSQFDGAIFGGALMGGLSLAMATGIGCINPIQERELKIRGQLRISGVSFSMYWLSAFTVDYLWYLIIAVVYIISLAAFKVASLSSGGAILCMIFLFIGWGLSGVLTSYCGSFIYDKFETAQSTWNILLQLAALTPYIVVSLLDQIGSSSTSIICNIIFSLIDPYYAGFGGFYYITLAYSDYVKKNPGVTSAPMHVYFDWTYPMIPFSLIVVYLHSVILFFLLQIIDIKKNGGSLKDAFGCLFGSYKKIENVEDTLKTVCEDVEEEEEDEEEDEDVILERNKVKQILECESEKKPVIVVSNLKKNFRKKISKNCKKSEEVQTKIAVKDLSLTVSEGEVLGLLGPNGAGKTTTINMITAEYGASKGKIWVSGYDIQSNVSGAFQNMGYCSQDNPIWENLTLKEHLKIYCLAHGVPKNMINFTIDSYLDALGIREHENKPGKALSGGTKRKLCFAIAMIGNPQVVLLDEPSTGMDPKTKRFMWDTIGKAFEGTNRGAILTTHYMDEADALCSKIAIMVMGKLKCIGSTQHLKSKFGQGYVLEIKLHQTKSENSNKTLETELEDFIFRLFGRNIEKPEIFGNRYIYKISRDAVVNLSNVFKELESNKKSLSIEEYSFSQSTLEQVFVQFAKEQDDSKLEVQ